MDAVREFRREDVNQVAALWLRAFHRRDTHAAKPLQDYFREIFFESPWADADLPSLVYEQSGCGIVGFLGVIPRWMTFNRQRIKVAVATQLMVDERATGYPGAMLMRRLFAGKQDLSYSDGANDFSQRLWRSCGGDVATLHSLKWTRILRPAQYGRTLLANRKGWPFALLAAALRPVCGALDAVVAQTKAGSRWRPDSPGTWIEDQPADETILWCIEHLGSGRALTPGYGIDSFRWLLRKAGEKTRHGALKKAVVRDPNGTIAGWYLYYLEPGAVSEVLQFGARPGAVQNVLSCLFIQARRQGAVAVSGGIVPRLAQEIATSRCELAWPGCAVVAHSKNRDILNAIHQGNAFLTRLEGEWWARFSDPEWTLDEPAPDIQIAGAGAEPYHPRMDAG